MKSKLGLSVVLWAVWGCGDGDGVPAQESWSRRIETEGAALLSVHGTSAEDVWVAGADDGTGPMVLHYDGEEWSRQATGRRGDLWWVHAFEEGPVFFGGTEAQLLRLEDGNFERLSTPGLGKHTVFGVWGAAADDVYAVGAVAGRNGFIWHYDGEVVREVALPDGLPEDEYRDVPGLFKVWGSSERDVWVVGANGVVLRGNAEDGFEVERAGGQETLFTVHGEGPEVVMVGGGSEGLVLNADGQELEDVTPSNSPLLQGVHVTPDGTIWAVGQGGAIFSGKAGELQPVDPGIDVPAAESLHSVWVDPEGGVWTVGGNVLTPDLNHGVALRLGPQGAGFELKVPEPAAPTCPEAQIDPAPNGSIARRWNEQLLNAIRRDIPRPGVHARNLFHFSLAVWDGYSAYDSNTQGYLLKEKLDAEDVARAREEAISYAAYRVLRHRYATAIGGKVSAACFDAFMEKLGFDPEATDTEGDSPRAFGNRLGQAIIDDFANDGAAEEADYADPEGFTPEGPTLVVDKPGTKAEKPTQWQRLVLAKAETQNGIPGSSGAQAYICAQWGDVVPFALTREDEDEPYLDIGTPPLELDDHLVESAMTVLRRSSQLDVDDDTEIDVSPGAMGNNSLGTNDGAGYPDNPVTGEPYAPERVKRSDFARVLAEFWADGPTSETPPGHWNTIANHAGEHPDFRRRLYGAGPELDPLAWDAHLYLALNGAVHDAAIAAWELKRRYVTARPITLIRYMAQRGQRSDSSLPSYDPEGLPLIEGLSELITAESSAPGERHQHLARYVGEVAVRSWRGEPGDRKTEIGGVAWMRAMEWMPYQRRTFVTPGFPGYVSGHSTFSRAAAVVLSGLTGSDYFPGGFASYRFEPGYLFFEYGPSKPIELQWATYFDAADQAGQSRVWGGIHVPDDDFDGRRIGARVGALALEKAAQYFESGSD